MEPTVSMAPMELMEQTLNHVLHVFLDALAKLDSGAILVNVTTNLDRGQAGPIGDVNVTLPLVIDIDVASLLQLNLQRA